MTQSKNSLLASVLAESKTLQGEMIGLEGAYQQSLAALKTQQQKIQNLGAVARDLTIQALESVLLPAIKGHAPWCLQGLIVQAVPLNDEWWKVFFFQQLADETEVLGENIPPGFYWSFDPSHRIKVDQRSLGDGELVRWGDRLPKINPKSGILGCLLANPVTGDVQVTLDRQTAFPEPPKQPEAAPAPAAPAAAAPAEEAAPAPAADTAATADTPAP